MRPLLLGPLGAFVLARAARTSMPALEREVRALGRVFGRHSVERDGTHVAPDERKDKRTV